MHATSQIEYYYNASRFEQLDVVGEPALLRGRASAQHGHRSLPAHQAVLPRFRQLQEEYANEHVTVHQRGWPQRRRRGVYVWSARLRRRRDVGERARGRPDTGECTATAQARSTAGE